MTLEQLERRVNDLERQLAELRDRIAAPEFAKSAEETFGSIGDDPDFDEIIRLGREYRREANNEGS